MKTIGMIVPTADNSFFSGLIQYSERYLRAQGYTLLICSSDQDAEKEKNDLVSLVELGASGILCVSGLNALPDHLLKDEVPLVWVDRVPESSKPIPWVANDDAEAMKEATNVLIEKGCKNILLVPGYLAEHQESPRVKGYREALEEGGIEFCTDYVLNRKGEQSSETETEELVREHLRKGNPVDGIITSSDRAAFGAMAALRSVGYYVPEDVKLISFDNSPYSTMGTPAITALDRNPKELAETACKILLKQINHEHDFPLEHRIPVSLVKRDSTR